MWNFFCRFNFVSWLYPVDKKENRVILITPTDHDSVVSPDEIKIFSSVKLTLGWTRAGDLNVASHKYFHLCWTLIKLGQRKVALPRWWGSLPCFSNFIYSYQSVSEALSGMLCQIRSIENISILGFGIDKGRKQFIQLKEDKKSDPRRFIPSWGWFSNPSGEKRKAKTQLMLSFIQQQFHCKK